MNIELRNIANLRETSNLGRMQKQRSLHGDIYVLKIYINVATVKLLMLYTKNVYKDYMVCYSCL